MSKEIVNVVSKLGSTRSRNEKDKILNENKDLPGLKEFFKAALDPFNTYYIKKIPQYDAFSESKVSLSAAIIMLEHLKNRTFTGNAAIEYLGNILSSMSNSEADLLCRVIKKDPDCGVSRETVNKVWPGLIDVYPILLCSAYSEKAAKKLKWEAGVYVQLKSDGARCNIIIDDAGIVTMFSRQGRPIDCKGRFDYLGNKHRSVVIDGELLYKNPNGVASRKEGNGIVNKAIKGTISEEEAGNLFLMAWDIIPLQDFKNKSCNLKYSARLGILTEHYVDGDGIHLTPTEIVYSLDDAFEIYRKYRDMGLEGAILKNMDAKWEDDRSKDQVKLKAEIVSTLKVVGYQEGRDQFEGLMGALICESECGKVRVSVGGGWSMDMRAQVAASHHNKPVYYRMVENGAETEKVKLPENIDIIGRYLDVLHNGLVDCGGQWSLYLPRANTGDFRYDKSEADTFEEIQSKK